MCGEVGPADVGRRLTLAGWVDSRRDHGGLVFVDLRDASGICQLVLNPERAPEAAEAGHQIRNEFVLRAEGEVVERAPENVNPDLPDRHRRAPGRPARDPLALDAAAVPARRGGRRRDAAAPLPVARPQAAADAAQPPAPSGPGLDDPPGDGGGRLPRHPDADPLQADARGRARLRRAEPPAAGPLLRAAAVAADPQTAPRDRRLRPLLPDRDLLPRRGPERGSSPGDHAARRRDGVPGAGVSVRAHGADVHVGLARGDRRRARDAVPAHDPRGGTGPLRKRQAGPALRARDRGRDRGHARIGVRRLRGRGGRPVPPRPAGVLARASWTDSRRSRGSGGPKGSPTSSSPTTGRCARRSPSSSPRPSWRTSAPIRARPCSSPRTSPASTARVLGRTPPPPGARARPRRRGGLALRLDHRLSHVRVGRGGRSGGRRSTTRSRRPRARLRGVRRLRSRRVPRRWPTTLS